VDDHLTGHEAGLALRRHAGEPGLAGKRPVRQPVAGKETARGRRVASRLQTARTSRPSRRTALGVVLLRTVLNAMPRPSCLTALGAVRLRTVRPPMLPQPAAARSTAAAQPAMGHLRTASHPRHAAESIAHPREAAGRSAAAQAAQPAKSAVPAVPAERWSALESDDGGRTAGQAKANGRYGAGEEQHVSHLQHATLQLSLSSIQPPRHATH
jgi:hypothetical protein